MANIKLKNGQGTEVTYSNVNEIKVPSSTTGTVSYTYTADANATAADILSGKTGYVNGTKLTGTITTITPSVSTYSSGSQITSFTPSSSAKYVIIPKGYNATAGYVKANGDTNLTAQNIKKDVSIFGVTGTYDPSSAITNTSTVSVTVVPPSEGSYGSGYSTQVSIVNTGHVDLIEDVKLVIATNSSYGYNTALYKRSGTSWDKYLKMSDYPMTGGAPEMPYVSSYGNEISITQSSSSSYESSTLIDPTSFQSVSDSLADLKTFETSTTHAMTVVTSGASLQSKTDYMNLLKATIYPMSGGSMSTSPVYIFGSYNGTKWSGATEKTVTFTDVPTEVAGQSLSEAVIGYSDALSELLPTSTYSTNRYRCPLKSGASTAETGNFPVANETHVAYGSNAVFVVIPPMMYLSARSYQVNVYVDGYQESSMGEYYNINIPTSGFNCAITIVEGTNTITFAFTTK